MMMPPIVIPKPATGIACEPEPYTPLISIIVPTLNEEKLVARTLSLCTPELRERYRLELIVSDGGSNDNTLSIAAQYADCIVTHNKPQRQTIAGGRNAGAAVAQGNILVFLNADTIPAEPEQFFEGIYRWAEILQQDSTHHDLPLAFTVPVLISPEDRTTADTVFHTLFNRYVRLLNTIGTGMGRGECQIIRADIFHAVGGYSAKISAGEDFDLYHRIRQRGRIGWMPESLVYESPRRFRRFGYTAILWSWTINALSVLIRRRALVSEWEPIR